METRDIALIKALSNGAGGASYTLPIASSTQLGGVQPAAKTKTMTQAVGVDADGALWTEPGGGGSSGGISEEVIMDVTLEEEASVVTGPTMKGSAIYQLLQNHTYLKVEYIVKAPSDATLTSDGKTSIGIYRPNWYQYWIALDAGNTPQAAGGGDCQGAGIIDSGLLANYCHLLYKTSTSQTFSYSSTIDRQFTSSDTGNYVFRASTTTAFGAGSRFRIVAK